MLPRRLSAIALSAAACAGLTALAAWLFEWSFERAVALAPVVVVVAGLTAALFVLWARIVVDALRGRRRGS